MTRSYTPTADGRVLIRDEETGRMWRVSPQTVALLEALEAGWQPGRPIPTGLEDVGELRGDDLAALVARLERQGLVGDRPAPAATSHLERGVALIEVSVPPRARRWGVVAGLMAPFVAVVLAAAAVVSLGGQGLEDVLAAARTTEATAWLEALLIALALQLALVLPHEMGHAIPMAAAIGRPIAVGVRVRGLMPQAYSDVHQILALPRQRERVAVLLGGTSAELTGWAAVVLGLTWFSPGLPGALVLALAASGLASVVLNLAPFRGTDGYWLWSELTDHRRLEAQGQAAAYERFFHRLHRRSHPPWLAWYGLADLYLVPMAILGLAVTVGLATRRWPPALVVGVALAAAAARGARRRARAAHVEEGQRR